MDRGAWRAHGVAESDTTEQLTLSLFFLNFQAICAKDLVN